MLGQFGPELSVGMIFGVCNQYARKIHCDPDKSLHECTYQFMLAQACEHPQVIIRKKKMPTSKEGASQPKNWKWPEGLPLPPPPPKGGRLIPPPPPLPAKLS